MKSVLKCPHGLEVACDQRQGLKIYRHLDDGTGCCLLNGLLVTPEMVVEELGRTFVRKRCFSVLAASVDYSGQMQFGGDLASQRELNEFLVCFNAAGGVRKLVYETLDMLALSGDAAAFKELLTLVVVAFSYPRYQADALAYKARVRELVYFVCPTLDVLLQLVGAGSSQAAAVEAFYEEVRFQLCYEFFAPEEGAVGHKVFADFYNSLKSK
ncbi:hypothetical protein [Phascolarctobacterium sp.]|uniref:hypothetical protein n=1 Tax=Phascolarctobacterium sp. TaxID=2049039 RepID=UPI003077B527